MSPYLQRVTLQVGENKWSFSVEPVRLGALGFEFEGTLPLSIEMIEYYDRSSFKFYVRGSLKLNCTLQVDIIMSDFEEMENSIGEKEMIEDLMVEDFGDPVPHRQQRRAIVDEVTASSLSQEEPINEISKEIPFEPPAFVP